MLIVTGPADPETALETIRGIDDPGLNQYLTFGTIQFFNNPGNFFKLRPGIPDDEHIGPGVLTDFPSRREKLPDLGFNFSRSAVIDLQVPGLQGFKTGEAFTSL